MAVLPYAILHSGVREEYSDEYICILAFKLLISSKRERRLVYICLEYKKAGSSAPREAYIKCFMKTEEEKNFLFSCGLVGSGGLGIRKCFLGKHVKLGKI